MTLEKIITEFDSGKFLEIQKRFNLVETDYQYKYFKYLFELKTKSQFVSEIGLDTTKNKTILDISGAMGYFSYICKQLGHLPTVTDVDDPVYDIVRKEFFGFDKITFCYPNDKYIPLPDQFKSFDVIVSLSIIPMSFWSSSDWSNFIQDCMAHLNPDGLLYIRPNHSDGLENLLELAKTMNNVAKINKHFVMFKKD